MSGLFTSISSRKTLAGLMIGLLLAVFFVVNEADSARAAHSVSPITLTAISTPFNSPIGIDHHEPSNQLLMSVNYSNGLPYNFELVAADGSRVQFSPISGLTNEIKIATVRTSGSMGGFVAGEAFTGSGVPGQIVRIAPDGASALIPWVTLPGETGLMRGSMFQDRYGAAGGDLVVVTTSGKVWRVTSGGTPTLVASLGVHLEGVTTVPNDSATYGPWAGRILAGAEGQGRIYAVAPDGSGFDIYNLGINPEDFDIVPANENFFGVNFGASQLMGAPASEFADKIGHILITQEIPGILWDVFWDGSAFHKTNIAQVAQWEHVTFSPAGVLEIPPPIITDCLDEVTWVPVAGSFVFDPAVVANGPAGTFTFDAKMTNVGVNDLTDLVAPVVTLSPDNRILNYPESPATVGDTLTLPLVGGYSDGTLSPAEMATFTFVVGLDPKAPFSFFVDLTCRRVPAPA